VGLPRDFAWRAKLSAPPFGKRQFGASKVRGFNVDGQAALVEHDGEQRADLLGCVRFCKLSTVWSICHQSTC
jgi:hypothetical protein